MEDIPEDLKPFYNDNSDEDQLSRLHQLPDYLDQFGRRIQDNRRYHYVSGDLQPIQCEINKINDLSSNERLSLFTALFPGIATEVELTYVYFSQPTKLSNFEFGSSDLGTYENGYFKNTLWLTLFAGSIKGYENQGLGWFIDHEKNFDIGGLLAALIAKEDRIGKEVLEKILLLPISNENVLNAFLCTPLNIGETYLKNNLISTMSWIVDGNKVNQTYRQLGEKNWNILLGYVISGLSARRRAKIKTYADVLAGKYTTEGLLKSFKEMEENKHAYARDFVVALGFLPFKQEPERMNDIVSRYQTIMEYIRESKKFGNDRQTGNKNAAWLGLRNLAHNVGYSDVKKFELAMEAEAVKDLAFGPVILEVDKYEVSLFLNALGEPKLEIRKNNTVVNSFPDKLKNIEEVQNLKNRVKQIKRQVGRLRNFLEESMCDSNEYSLFEFQGLMDHPILRLMMEQLVFISPKGMGYPTQKGSVLFAYDGTEILLENHEKLRIAHSYDLLTAGVWNQWQRECFDAKRIQPFKQVFREVYVVTDAEKNESHESHRFFGQIVKGRQALILLKSKGWECQSLDVGGSCFAYKGFWHMRAILSTAFRMRDLENVGTVSFENNKINKIPLIDIPPIIFSEAIRDMDLVVSVAYAGDGGWEGTTSTIESRTALVRETCALLHLGNVHIENNFAFVEGMLASYKVHLGSGSIHQVPGNYVCVIPDNAKSIGKLFLPFIDKDQMTSIILSKIVLLAHDDKIKDPVILRQIKRID